MTKKSQTKTYEQLIFENEELRSHLIEAEETLNAIRKGEVDAIVISGRKGDQIYSISSAETPYRTFVEEMNEGALTLTKEGLILFCNKKFAELVNEPIDKLMGSYFNRFIVPKDRSKLKQLLSHKKHNKNYVLIVSLTNSLYLKLAFRLLPSYLQGDNFILIATDITEIKKKEKELIELNLLLAKHLSQLKVLRIDLINGKIESDISINKLVDANEKLVKEIYKFKQVESSLKKKTKSKK